MSDVLERTILGSDIVALLQAPPPAWVAAFHPSRAPRPAAVHPDATPAGAASAGASALPASQLRFTDPAAPPAKLSAHHGQCTVIFDGQLANRPELLRAAQRSPADHLDDPALVLQLYLRLGDAVLDRLRGSYALLIWDAGRGQLLAARDTRGSVPLFYTRANGNLLFSTSVDALLRRPGVDRALNPLALAETLAHRHRLPEETYYRSIRRVVQAHALRVRDGVEESFQYWEPAPPGTPDGAMRAGDLAQFDDLLHQAVARVLARGPAAIYLSGGLDSVSIAAVVAGIGRANGAGLPLALSLAFPDPSCDERAVQTGVAAGLGLDQVLLPFSQAVGEEGLLAPSLALSATLAAPLQNPWRPAYIALAHRGRRAGRRVILTGVGGDDWLTVNSYFMADLLRRGDLAGSYRLVRNMLRSYTQPRGPMIRFLLWRSGLRPLLLSRAGSFLGRLAPERVYRWRRNWLLRNATLPGWLAPAPPFREALQERAAQHAEAAARRPEPQGPYAFYNATNISHTFIQQQPSLEQEEDYAIGRRLGLQFAHPYWDPDLVNFLCRVPPRLLLSGGREKGLVRQAVARRFPNLAFERQRKVSAGDFFYDNLRAQAPAAHRQLGPLVALGELGLVDPDRVDALIAGALAGGDNRQQHAVWELLMMEAWARPRL